MTAASVLDVLVPRAAVELARVSVLRPALKERCGRAVEILQAHRVDPRAGVMVARMLGGELVGYRVRSQGNDPSRAGRRYTVEAEGSGQCTCPDARPNARHRRRDPSRACKHALAAWALWRSSSGTSPPEVERIVAQLETRSAA